jgi:hypothetical protein
MITASQVQIAVLLADCAAAQLVLDATCPGDFDVSSLDRTVWARAAAPTVPAVAVAQGKVDQAKYAALGAAASAVGISHLAIGFWEGSTYTPAAESGTLWAAMEIVAVEEPI